MYSEFSRYNKTNTIVHVQNQQNHYRQIINPRNTMRLKEDKPNRYLSLHHNNKFSQNEESKRKRENDRLNTHLMRILNGKGLLYKMEEKANKMDKRNMTLVNQFKTKEGKKDLFHENKILVNKITDAKPLIGSHGQWKAHQIKFKNIKKNIGKRLNQQVLDPSIILKDTILSISQRQNQSSVASKTKLQEKSLGEQSVKIRRKKPKKMKIKTVLTRKTLQGGSQRPSNENLIKMEGNKQQNIYI